MPTNPKECRCPNRPHATLGSWASGSVSETRAVSAWTAEHGDHPYAKARDELSGPLQHAERSVGSGGAVLDMVADVYGLPRTFVPGSEHSAPERITHDAESVTP
jgi:hypothetical protein